MLKCKSNKMMRLLVKSRLMEIFEDLVNYDYCFDKEVTIENEYLQFINEDADVEVFSYIDENEDCYLTIVVEEDRIIYLVLDENYIVRDDMTFDYNDVYNMYR